MRTRIAVALGIVYVVWGSTYLAIAVADRTLPPLLMLAVRFGLAGGLLYAWSAWRGDVRASRLGRREWTAAAIVGGLLLFVDTGGVACAEQRVASGLTALLVSTVPLFTAVLDRTFFGIRLSLGALAGIAAGLLGVALLVGQSGHIDPVGAAVVLGAALAWAAGSAYGRVAPLPKPPFLSAAMQMLCAAATPRRCGNSDGRARSRAPDGGLGRVGRGLRLSRRLRLDHRLHRVRLAVAERRAEHPGLDVRVRQPCGRRPARLGASPERRSVVASSPPAPSSSSSVGMLVLARHAPHEGWKRRRQPASPAEDLGMRSRRRRRSARTSAARRRRRGLCPSCRGSPICPCGAVSSAKVHPSPRATVRT